MYFVSFYASLEWQCNSGYFKQHRKRKVSNVKEMKGEGRARRRKWIFTKFTDRVHVHMRKTNSRICTGAVLLTKILIIDMFPFKYLRASFTVLETYKMLQSCLKGRKKQGAEKTEWIPTVQRCRTLCDIPDGIPQANIWGSLDTHMMELKWLWTDLKTYLKLVATISCPKTCIFKTHFSPSLAVSQGN